MPWPHGHFDERRRTKGGAATANGWLPRQLEERIQNKSLLPGPDPVPTTSGQAYVSMCITKSDVPKDVLTWLVRMRMRMTTRFHGQPAQPNSARREPLDTSGRPPSLRFQVIAPIATVIMMSNQPRSPCDRGGSRGGQVPVGVRGSLWPTPHDFPGPERGPRMLFGPNTSALYYGLSYGQLLPQGSAKNRPVGWAPVRP